MIRLARGATHSGGNNLGRSFIGALPMNASYYATFTDSNRHLANQVKAGSNYGGQRCNAQGVMMV